MSNSNNDETRSTIERIQRRKAGLLKKLATMFVTIDEQRQKEIGDVDADEIDEMIDDLTLDYVELKEFNDELYKLITDNDEQDTLIESDYRFDTKLRKQITATKKLKQKLEPAVTTATATTPTPAPMPEQKPPIRRAKVPDLKIPTFSGSFLEWYTFKETFDAIIGDKEDYTPVEKFQYLAAQLSGDAKRCIAGYAIVGANYVPAYDQLKERFGNVHLVISAHMKQITQLKRVSKNSGELRKLLDLIQSHVRSLETKGVNKGHFGALLIPIIQDKIPDNVDLTISRKMGKDQWDIDDYLQYLQEEVEAPESCKSTWGRSRNQQVCP